MSLGEDFELLEMIATAHLQPVLWQEYHTPRVYMII